MAELAQDCENEEIRLLFEVNREAGCRIADLVELIEEHLSFLQRANSKAQVAAGSAKFTASVMLGMPWISLLICQWVGMDPIGFLLGEPIGWLLLGIVAALSVTANFNARKLIASTIAESRDPGFTYDLAAALVSIGYRNTLRLVNVTADSAIRLRAQSAELRAKHRFTLELKLEKLPQLLMLNSAALLMPAALLLSAVPAVLAGLAGLSPAN